MTMAFVHRATTHVVAIYVLLALQGAFALKHIAGIHDVRAIVKSIRRRPSESSVSSMCECLSWKKVYGDSMVSCLSQGLELYPQMPPFPTQAEWAVDFSSILASRHDPYELGAAYQEHCTNFHHRMEDNSCMSITSGHHPGNWYGGSWCYVSAECSELNGGMHLQGSAISWKLCQADQDTSLRSRHPHQLFQLARQQGFDLGVLLRKAYPKAKMLWSTAADFYRTSASKRSLLQGDSQLSSEEMDELQDVFNSRKPTIFHTREDLSGHRVLVMGEHIWNITARRSTPLGVLYDTACVQGCDAHQLFDTQLSVGGSDPHDQSAIV